MSDIVDNLSDYIRAGFDPHNQLKEARSEIERLRAENARLREAWMMEKQIGVRAFEKMCELAKALQSIAANTCCSTCREAALVARAALAGKEEK